MPKKTKKEKIIAEYRRKLQAVVSNQIPTKPPRQPQTRSPSYRLTPIESPKSVDTPTTSAIFPNDIATIRQDLTKTIVLAAATIAIEFLLYWQIGR